MHAFLPLGDSVHRGHARPGSHGVERGTWTMAHGERYLTRKQLNSVIIVVQFSCLDAPSLGDKTEQSYGEKTGMRRAQIESGLE
jgi:hypothetical protein